MKFAVTLFAERIVTVQTDPDVESQPVQPVNTDTPVGMAVRVTDVFKPKSDEQVPPHSIPPGFELT